MQIALEGFLRRVGSSPDTGKKNVGMEASELPVKIALSHSSSSPAVNEMIATRKDVSLGLRLQAVAKIPKDSGGERYNPLVKKLMTSADANDRYVAAVAFTTAQNYNQEAAQFLIKELTSGTPTRVSVLFQTEAALKTLYDKAEGLSKEKVKQFASEKGISLTP